MGAARGDAGRAGSTSHAPGSSGAGSTSHAPGSSGAGSTSHSHGSGGAGRELEARWLAGQADAFEAAHRRYRSRLEAVAQRILGSRPDAEDVVQRVFVALRDAEFRGESSLWTYLYRSAVNGAVNALRARKRRERAEERLLQQELGSRPLPRGFESPESVVLEGEMLAAVARALLQVKPQHRRVLTLRILHGLSNTEISEREQIPLATVGTWLRRGRQELQRGLRPLLKEMGRDGS